MKLLFKIIRRVNLFYKKQVSIIESKILVDNIIKFGGAVGKNFRVGNNVTISGLGKAVFGENISIGSGSFIRADGGLIIGDNVVISRNVVIYTISHNYEGDRLPFDETNIENPVIIENNVWIGMNVTVSPGSIIREGAIVGLGTRVWGEVDKGTIVGSERLRILKSRDMEHYQKLNIRN